jgi:hypothetical protein
VCVAFPSPTRLVPHRRESRVITEVKEDGAASRLAAGLLRRQLLRLIASDLDLDRLKDLKEAEITQSGHPGRRRG